MGSTAVGSNSELYKAYIVLSRELGSRVKERAQELWVSSPNLSMSSVQWRCLFILLEFYLP